MKDNAQPLSHNTTTETLIHPINLKSKDFYWKLLIKKTKQCEPACKNKWIKEFIIEPDSWESIFLIPFTACRETKLQTFQYKIIHRIFPCNKWLYTVKVSDSPLCPICGDKEDTIVHFFASCNHVLLFWNSLVQWWHELEFTVRKLLPLTLQDIIFGLPCNNNEDRILNYTLILAKQYIYEDKKYNKKGLFFGSFLVKLKNKLLLENYICGENVKNVNKYGNILSNLLDAF